MFAKVYSCKAGGRSCLQQSLVVVSCLLVSIKKETSGDDMY